MKESIFVYVCVGWVGVGVCVCGGVFFYVEQWFLGLLCTIFKIEPGIVYIVTCYFVNFTHTYLVNRVHLFL